MGIIKTQTLKHNTMQLTNYAIPSLLAYIAFADI